MSHGSIFISHASADDAFVRQLREALEAQHYPVWDDSRKLRGGDKLAPEIEQAIASASQVIVVLSRETVNSRWVRREIEKAVEVEKRRRADGYRVIPVILPGLTPSALENWFAEEPVAIPVQLGVGELAEALPSILAALGERLPTERNPTVKPETKPIAELVLALTDPKIEIREGTRRVTATATLTYEPPANTARAVTSRRFAFTVPTGPIEANDLRWYLEQYFLWPIGVFEKRAREIEKKLPRWGQDLFMAALNTECARASLAPWQHAGDAAERRFSVQVDGDLPDGTTPESQALTREAATELLTLPWEILHDGHGWLFQGKHPACVRRRLPNREAHAARTAALPIRILLLSPRPENDGQGHEIGYIDHRVSARPLVEALEDLGELVRLTILTPPTYGALAKVLLDGDHGHPFDVVHFDGHGTYDRRLGLGGLCFEDPKDAGLSEKRAMEFIDASRLAEVFRAHRVPLVFLEACQTALAELDPTASVAASLLEEGVTSVVAMSHSVLVETARRFVQAFYGEVARGSRVGQAMLAGQRALHDDTWRGKVLGAGDLRLQDWFVPVLYQERQDPQLITKIPTQEVQQLEARKRKFRLGALPVEPAYKFQGRSHELLALERLLQVEPWAVVRGIGGAGKTAIAVELARWLTRIGRFGQAAFVSLEHHRDPRAVLDTIGHQLLGRQTFSVAQYLDLDAAFQPVERALAERATIVVFDNCESILPIRPHSESSLPAGGEDAILSLCRRLIDADPGTRLIFTSRESLPPPFNHRGRERELPALDRVDAIELVAEVMKQNGWTPPAADPGSTPAEITALVDAVHCHARALVLLAPEVALLGVRTTTAALSTLMADLERKSPGDRENSLYASVELSLRRLPPELRQRVRVLGVCQGGVSLPILGTLTGLERDATCHLASELIAVGLGEDMGYGHLRLDPGLPPYLSREMSSEETAATRAKWAEGMVLLTNHLYEESSKNTQLATQLVLLELPNLLAMLEYVSKHFVEALAEDISDTRLPGAFSPATGVGTVEGNVPLDEEWPPERVVCLANQVEMLVARLGQPQALALAARVRREAAQKLGDWSHARFRSDDATFDRLLEFGDLSAAHDAAQQLLEHCIAAGEVAYPGAAYDLSMAHFNLGRVLRVGFAAEAALAPLAEAQRRFQLLADAGDASAEQMASAAITETGSCLCDLGRLDESAAAYEEGLKRDKAKNRLRDVDTGKFQLGTVRLLQKRFDAALEIFTESREAAAAMGEPLGMASALHQIGRVHQLAGRYESAEQAYRQSLAITVRESNFAGQALTLGQLGNLYGVLGRFEEAVAFYRQCLAIDIRQGKLAQEGMTRNNLANALVRLRRHDEARLEIQRAIECKKLFGHAAEIWTTWAILEDLERTIGNAEAAQAARHEAIRTYLEYRRTGGISQSTNAQIYAQVAEAIRRDAIAEVRRGITQFASHPNQPPYVTALVSKLHALLAGGRSPDLVDDPALDCLDAAELQLLQGLLGA